MPLIYDMHCHLGFARNADELFAALGEAPADALGETPVHALSCTVLPEEFERMRADSRTATSQVTLALGLHPWWIADESAGEESIALFERLASQTAFIGEIGLDFRGGRAATRDAQLAALNRLLDACSDGGKLISLHSCCAEDTLLDTLEQHDAFAKHDCILHWFSGSSAQLQRTLALGCFFSVGPRMAASKRGRAYVRVIPADRLLLETDMPSKEDTPLSPAEWHDALRTALEAIASERGDDPAQLAAVIANNSARLLSR